MASISIEIRGSLWFPTIFIDFRNPCTKGRYANYPNPFWLRVFLLREQMGVAKPCVLLLRNQKRASDDSSKTLFSFAGRNECFKNDEEYHIAVKN